MSIFKLWYLEGDAKIEGRILSHAEEFQSCLRNSLADHGILREEERHNVESVHLIIVKAQWLGIGYASFFLEGVETEDNSWLTPQAASIVFLENAVPGVILDVAKYLQNVVSGIRFNFSLWNFRGKFGDVEVRPVR